MKVLRGIWMVLTMLISPEKMYNVAVKAAKRIRKTIKEIAGWYYKGTPSKRHRRKK